MATEKQIRQTISTLTTIIRTLINPAFKIPKGGANIRTIAKPLDSIEKEYGSVTPERLVDYCVYVAYKFRGRKETKLSTMLGPKVLNDFKDQSRGSKYYQDKWLSNGGLSRQSLLDKIKDRRNHPQAKYIYVASEENTKLRQLNRKVGYAICQTSTLGWSPLSGACAQCDFIELCKKETESKYPEIFRLRIEHGGA